jgi:hypothetical protein
LPRGDSAGASGLIADHKSAMLNVQRAKSLINQALPKPYAA